MFRRKIAAMLICVCAISAGAEQYTIKTAKLARTIEIKNGKLTTLKIENLLTSTVLPLADAPEFSLRFSQGTHTTGTDFTMTIADFSVQQITHNDREISIRLRNMQHGITVTVHYLADSKTGVLRKYLEVKSERDITLERIEIEFLKSPDVYQPYTKDAITAHAPSNWSPNLGQPLYSHKSGMFFGVEFPASRNLAKDGMVRTGYLRGRKISSGSTYRTYNAVIGASDDPGFVADAFMRYINAIRCRPFRLQTQYNSWFDYGNSVDKNKFTASVRKTHQELVKKRGVKPLTRYVIDDGWQSKGDWTQKVWTVNHKFTSNFQDCRAAVKSVDSTLGLWLSPGCLFGAQIHVPKLRDSGFEAMDNWMSMAGPRYMQALEDRMVELTATGITFFKLDGVFGHLNTRNFELHGDRYGIPYMPQLNTDGIKANDKRLNSSKYNEVKLYYLTAGTERLMQIFQHLAKINPDIYLLISNGAYLSPWWLMHVDAVWMINAGDAAGGSSRTQELVYRDSRYYKIFKQENTQFPLNSLFNHEPKKRKTGEPEDVFRKYLYMCLSRGSGFVELYIKPFVLSDSDWDVLAEGLRWVDANSELFIYARMHGGDPKKNAVYGYSGWNSERGYVSIHNPSKSPATYKLTLNRKLGVMNRITSYVISSPMPDSLKGLPHHVRAAQTITIELEPGEIRLLMFDKQR